MHLAPIPEAGERSHLGVDVLTLQVVQQLRAGVELGVTVAPVAHPKQAPIGQPSEALPAKVVVHSVLGREANRFRLRQDRALGALRHLRGVEEVGLDARR